MVIYALFTSLVLLTKFKFKRAIYLFFNVLPMIFVACVRDNAVGTDLSMYIDIYNNVIDYFDYYVSVLHIEYGYMLLNYMVKFLPIDTEIFFFFCL